MRVIAGSARGRKLESRTGLHTRPTSDRLRETVFNIISPCVFGSCFLDLFAGSGAMGIEALSRGAEKAVFVDNDAESIKIIKSNLDKLDMSDKSLVLHSDYRTALSKLSRMSCHFDLVYIDPPYHQSLGIQAVAEIAELGLISKHQDALVLLEQGSDENITDEIPCGHLNGKEGFYLDRIKKYTTQTLLIYKNR